MAYTEKVVSLHKTQPHAAHEIFKVVDSEGEHNPNNTIFVIRSLETQNAQIAMTGEEIEDFVQWWLSYKWSNENKARLG